MSHPMWVRGLKQKILIFVIRVIYVAPHVGAWIETSSTLDFNNFLKSHPMWVRGLKLTLDDEER